MPTRPQIQIHDNAMAPFTGADGDKFYGRDVIGWKSLPDNALQALSDVKYEKTEVPFVDANFQRQLDAAYQESFYGGLSDQQGCVKEEASPAEESQSLPTAQATNPVRL